MTELLAAGMVIPASLGVCCSVGVGAWSAPSSGSAGRRARAAAAARRALPVLAALLMLGAMLDMSLAGAGATGWAGRSIGWAAAMVLTALLVVGTGRVAGRVGHVDLHRALGLVVTASLVAVAHPGHSAGVAATSASAHGTHGGVGLAPAVVAAAVAFAGYSAWSAVTTWRGTRQPGTPPSRAVIAARLRGADAAGMAVMVLAMSAMLLG
ncbi:hypothetical protein [Agromyces kandeliae]|uniref:DUF5134 domain-containing protein n=1 Tax=Agromyces kandeliae TaxID=2666141 RepID=A0A6L5R383_9MICO|nr:hypothetical protein [Agromyces kandeliae]MRX44526.1 hypothetical protein [Agromyces kandeliae]